MKLDNEDKLAILIILFITLAVGELFHALDKASDTFETKYPKAMTGDCTAK